jgi:hypothetical protein
VHAFDILRVSAECCMIKSCSDWALNICSDPNAGVSMSLRRIDGVVSAGDGGDSLRPQANGPVDATPHGVGPRVVGSRRIGSSCG